MPLLALPPPAAWQAPLGPLGPGLPAALPGLERSHPACRAGGRGQPMALGAVCGQQGAPSPAGGGGEEGSVLLKCPLITCCWNGARLAYK